jgi:hypothetical protein
MGADPLLSRLAKFTQIQRSIRSMNLLLKLHQLAAGRGDGMCPQWLELLILVTSADGVSREPARFAVVQPGNHPDGVPVVPPLQDSVDPTLRISKAIG